MTSALWRFLLVAVSMWSIVEFDLADGQQSAFDDRDGNSLVEEPKINCDAGDALVTTFKTRHPIRGGRIYVKGATNDSRCMRNFGPDAEETTVSISINHGDCGMRRERLPQGLAYTIQLVVSFHGTFVIRFDRAYRIVCLMKGKHHLTNQLDMSTIALQDLSSDDDTSCSYTIRKQNPDGPVVRYAKVGDKLYHVWNCESEQHGILVHSCWVNDGRGTKFDLFDIKGCAIDPLIQPDVKYAKSLNKAYVETHGYKFSDTSVLNYQCIVELCKKAGGGCADFTPPDCGSRAKRSTNTMKGSASAGQREAFDMTTELQVVDTFDTSDFDGSSIDGLMNELNGLSVEDSKTQRNAICLGTVSYALVASLPLFLLTCFVAAAARLRATKKTVCS